MYYLGNRACRCYNSVVRGSVHSYFYSTCTCGRVPGWRTVCVHVIHTIDARCVCLLSSPILSSSSLVSCRVVSVSPNVALQCCARHNQVQAARRSNAVAETVVFIGHEHLREETLIFSDVSPQYMQRQCCSCMCTFGFLRGALNPRAAAAAAVEVAPTCQAEPPALSLSLAGKTC